MKEIVSSGSTSVEILISHDSQFSLYSLAGPVHNAMAAGGSMPSSGAPAAYTPGTWGRILDIISR